MLTAKLNTYSPVEVDLLKKVLEQGIDVFLNSSNANCKTADCNTCKVKHVCYDISKMHDYLTFEAKYDYPHCKK